MDIRQATLEDYDAVDALLKEMRADRTVDSLVFTNMLRSSTCAVMVAISDGAVTGMGICNIVAKLDREECRIDEVVVLEKYRGKGIGKTLFAACEAWAWSHPNVDRIEFTSRPSREDAHTFYKNHGYKIRETVVFCKKRGEA